MDRQNEEGHESSPEFSLNSHLEIMILWLPRCGNVGNAERFPSGVELRQAFRTKSFPQHSYPGTYAPSTLRSLPSPATGPGEDMTLHSERYGSPGSVVSILRYIVKEHLSSSFGHDGLQAEHTPTEAHCLPSQGESWSISSSNECLPQRWYYRLAFFQTNFIENYGHNRVMSSDIPTCQSPVF